GAVAPATPGFFFGAVAAGALAAGAVLCACIPRAAGGVVGVTLPGTTPGLGLGIGRACWTENPSAVRFCGGGVFCCAPLARVSRTVKPQSVRENRTMSMSVLRSLI